MPEAAVAELTASELASMEPKDKRTTEWKEWKAAHEAAIKREIAEAGKPPVRPAAPTVEAPPVSAPPSVAAPASASVRPILNPDEFLSLNSDPTAVSLFTGQPNSAAAFASAMVTAYQSYLLTRSPKFSRWYKAEMDAGRVNKQVLPDPTIVDRFYDIATGA